MIPPEPPDWICGPWARAAWVNGYQACIQRGVWDEGFRSTLSVLAMSCSLYVQFVREVAELDPAVVGDDLRDAIIEQRRQARECMIGFLLLEPSAIVGGPLRADGLDAEIAALCDVPPVQ